MHHRKNSHFTTFENGWFTLVVMLPLVKNYQITKK